MSKVVIQGNASGSGVLTIAAPNTNTDRTLTLPDNSGTVFVSGQALSATTGSFSGDVTLGSSVLATPSGSAPSYTCRAWASYNAASNSIRGSANISSITRNSTGNFTVSFSTAMPDANYSFVGACMNNVGINYAGNVTGADNVVNTGSFGIFASTTVDTLFNPNWLWIAVFR